MDSQSAAVITAAIKEQEASQQNNKEQYSQEEQSKQNINQTKQESLQQNEEPSTRESVSNDIVSEEQRRELQQLAQQQQAHQDVAAIHVDPQVHNHHVEANTEQQQFQVIQQQLNEGIKRKDNKILPRKSTQRPFAVDPELNVAVGIVQDIVGPRVHREQQQQEQQHFNNLANGSNQCTRCKKEFPVELDGKSYKLCPHCRDLQRQRSRRWQQRIKQKDGACKRCGVEIPPDQSSYVLCPPCRLNLRTRKANRFENGKCVHCSGVNDSTEFKVCTRCRNNDKMRRKNLEDRGCCNRCANVLTPKDENHKVCLNCRSRKRNTSKNHQPNASPDQHPLQQQQIQQLQQQPSQAQQQEPVTSTDNINYQQQFAQHAQQLEANLFAQ